MSNTCSIATVVNENFDEHSIDIPLKNGLELGFKYFNINDVEINLSASPLTLDQVSQRILFDASQNNFFEFSIFTKFEDTFFYFNFNKTKYDNLEIKFIDFINPWKKEVWNGQKNEYVLDFARYIRTMVKVCAGLSIKELKTIDYYNR